MRNTNYFLGIMTAVVGLMMLLAAEPVVQVLVIVLGISAVLNGAFILGAVLPLCSDRAFKIECLVRGLAGIVIGLLCIVLPLRVAKIAWQTLIYVFAFYAILSAAVAVPIAVTLGKDGFPVRRHVIEIISSLLTGIILFMLPTSIGFTIIRIGGALLLIAGAAIAFIAWKNRDITVYDAVVTDDD